MGLQYKQDIFHRLLSIMRHNQFVHGCRISIMNEMSLYVDRIEQESCWKCELSNDSEEPYQGL